MKKVTSIVLAALLVLGLAACGGAAPSSTTPASVPEEPAQSASVPASEPEEPESTQGLEADVGLLSVDISFPASLFEGGEQTPEEYAANATSEDGVLSAKANSDGSVTLTVTKQRHAEMLDEMKDSIDKSLVDYCDGTTFPSVKSIEANSNYSEFTVTVDKAAFESGLDGFVGLGLGAGGMMYIAVEGKNDTKVTINYKDEATGEVFNTVVYPDAMQSQG